MRTQMKKFLGVVLAAASVCAVYAQSAVRGVAVPDENRSLEKREQAAAPDYNQVKKILALAKTSAEEDFNVDFCGFFAGMSRYDAMDLAAFYRLKDSEYSFAASGPGKAVYRLWFSLKGVRRITKGGNTVDELARAVANRVGNLKRNFDTHEWERKTIDGVVVIFGERGLIIQNNQVASKAPLATAEAARKDKADVDAAEKAAEKAAAEKAARERAAREEAARKERAAKEAWMKKGGGATKTLTLPGGATMKMIYVAPEPPVPEPPKPEPPKPKLEPEQKQKPEPPKPVQRPAPEPVPQPKPPAPQPPPAAPAPAANQARIVDRQASLKRTINPEYPEGARRRREEGDVKVEMDIAANGDVSAVRVVSSSGYPELDSAAEKAALRAKFVPARSGRRNVPSTARITLEFRLRQKLGAGGRARFRGSFTMGSPESEDGRENDETQHRVTLTKGYWLGETEVTQGQWKSVMGSNPSYFKGDNRPVENVSWDDCQEFIRKVNAEAERQFGGEARLPTEAEWEYACRAGSTGAYAGTGDLDSMGWYGGNSGSKTHPVGQKRPNAWGFYDMHGNVWEWCNDWYGSYPSGSVTDPAGAASGDLRVLRGGGWNDGARYCRSAFRLGNFPADRYWLDPGDRGGDIGFRLACSAGPRGQGAEQ